MATTMYPTLWRWPTLDERAPVDLPALVRYQNKQLGKLSDWAKGVQDFNTVAPFRMLPKSVDRSGRQDATAAIEDTLGAALEEGASVWLGEGTISTKEFEIPGDNMAIYGSGSGYTYGSISAVRTILKARPGAGTNLIKLAVTGGIPDRTGCLLQDFMIDGDLQIANGVKVSSANLLRRVRVRGCLTAGVLLADLTNATRLEECGLIDNFGWGLKSEGSGTTTFSVEKTMAALNQLGGVDLEAGVVAHLRLCILESNGGPGARIYKSDAHLGAFGEISFDYCWLEGNALPAGFTLVIDAQTRIEANAPWRIRFRNTRFSGGKPHQILCGKWVTFEECNYSPGGTADAVTLGPEARHVAWLECEKGFDGSPSLTPAQFDSAIAQGFRCYSSSRDVQRVVGAGAPAAVFAGAWVNSGAPYGPAKYWFDREGVVCLSGNVKSGVIGTKAFTLPLGYRPPFQVDRATDSNSAYGTLRLAANGDVIPQVGSNVAFSLEGVRFATG